MSVRILHGDCREVLRTLPDASVQCCVTSPPYYGLRSYGIGIENGEIGLEQSPDEYVAQLVEVFRGVRRVLRGDGVVFLNLGDSYAANGPKTSRNGLGNSAIGSGAGGACKQRDIAGTLPPVSYGSGLKPKDLIGIPWRVAFALQADGWWLRSAVVWHKPNPLPESVRDRPTSAYEMVFLLAKSASYFYDQDAIRWPSTGRNAPNVWTISSKAFSESHFATMPPGLAERCIKAGTRAGDTVLDPFFGAGTTGVVADRLGRDCIGIELNPAYTAMASTRVERDAGLFAEVAAE